MKYEINFNCAHCGQPMIKTTTSNGNSQTKEKCKHCKKLNSVVSVKNELRRVGK